MQIIASNPEQHSKEHDQILRLLRAQRAQEWQSHQGFRRWWLRLKIEVWARFTTDREQWRKLREHSL